MKFCLKQCRQDRVEGRYIGRDRAEELGEEQNPTTADPAGWQHCASCTSRASCSVASLCHLHLRDRVR